MTLGDFAYWFLGKIIMFYLAFMGMLVFLYLFGQEYGLTLEQILVLDGIFTVMSMITGVIIFAIKRKRRSETE